MAQDRMLRASMRASEKVNGWPVELRFFWTQLWGYCDDHGRGLYVPLLIKADTFPLDESVSAAQVLEWMEALEESGVIVAYEVGGKRYFECVNWAEHQEPPYRKKTDIPDRFGVIPKPSKGSTKSPESSGNVSPNRRGIEGEVEGEGKAQSATPFCPKHPSGSSTPCRPCGDARKAYETSLFERKIKPTPTPPRKSDYCPEHDWLLKKDCDLEHASGVGVA